MKSLLLLIAIFISFGSFARMGYSIRDYSLLFGKTLYANSMVFNSFEFQYDRVKKTCLHRNRYLGFGASILFVDKIQSIGLKGMYNPTTRVFHVTRKMRIEPYLMLQVNLNRKQNNAVDYHNNVSPGLGLNGVWKLFQNFNFRTQLQVRYNINREFLSNKEGLRLDLRVGIGLNKLSFSKKENRDKT